MVKEKLLVSACFMHEGYKYNGKSNFNEQILALQEKYEFILVCPEVFGGLSVPRDPAEIIGFKVFTNKLVDVTLEYQKGAQKTLEIALNNGCKKALLKAKSPSCGKGVIYDGTFSHTEIIGDGITTKLLKENGIVVFTEEELKKL